MYCVKDRAGIYSLPIILMMAVTYCTFSLRFWSSWVLAKVEILIFLHSSRFRGIQGWTGGV